MRIKFGEDVAIISLLERKNHDFAKLFGEQVMAALDKPNGIYHVELFLTSNNEIIFNELNARVPGVLCVPCLQDCFGINFLDMELFNMLGQACPPRAIN